MSLIVYILCNKECFCLTCFISKYINSRKKINLITKYEVGDISIVGYSLFFDRHAKASLSLSLSLSWKQLLSPRVTPCLLRSVVNFMYEINSLSFCLSFEGGHFLKKNV